MSVRLKCNPSSLPIPILPPSTSYAKKIRQEQKAPIETWETLHRRNNKRIKWTPEMDERVAEMHQTLSYGEIARKMGMSRDMVKERVKRLRRKQKQL